ncbi:hypothetical protein EI94DRAFT_1813845 [Lactarius quietus]|nr:hypothetical protein EI94DRAFT_1813845 [Lactarius quietus]
MLNKWELNASLKGATLGDVNADTDDTLKWIKGKVSFKKPKTKKNPLSHDFEERTRSEEPSTVNGIKVEDTDAETEGFGGADGLASLHPCVLAWMLSHFPTWRFHHTIARLIRSTIHPLVLVPTGGKAEKLDHQRKPRVAQVLLTWNGAFWDDLCR